MHQDQEHNEKEVSYVESCASPPAQVFTPDPDSYPEVFTPSPTLYSPDNNTLQPPSYHNNPPPTAGSSASLKPDATTHHGSGPQAPQARKPANICGLRRRWAIVLAIALIVIAVVGGVVGGVVSSRQSQGGASDSALAAGGTGSATAPTGATTSPSFKTVTVSGGVPSPTGADPRERRIAAAMSTGGGFRGIQVFYQGKEKAAALYRVYESKSKWGPEVELALSRPLQEGAGLSTTSVYDNSTGNVLVNLFYIFRSGTSVDIVLAELVCGQGAGTCVESNSSVITAGATYKVHPQSSVAALRIDVGVIQSRVYYQSTEGLLVQLSNDGPWEDHLAGDGRIFVAIGSGIAATLSPGPYIGVFYSATSTANIMLLAFNAGWQAPEKVDANRNDASPLAACYQPALDAYRFYTVHPVSRDITEYARAKTTGDWKRHVGPTWGSPETGIACVCWDNSARLYHLGDSRLKETGLNDGRWTSSSQPV